MAEVIQLLRDYRLSGDRDFLARAGGQRPGWRWSLPGSQGGGTPIAMA